MAKAKAKPTARPRPPLGVYLSRSRETALAIRRTDHGIWYLTFVTGKVTTEFVGDDRFVHDFPFALPDYPIRKAIRIYNDSEFPRDDQTQKVLNRLLERL